MVHKHRSPNDCAVRPSWLGLIPLVTVLGALGLGLVALSNVSYPANAARQDSAGRLAPSSGCAPTLAFTLTADSSPTGMAYDAATGRLFVANAGGPGEGSLLIAFLQYRIYLPLVMNSSSGALSSVASSADGQARAAVVQAGSWPATKVITGLAGARSVAYDASRNRIYVAGGNKVYFVDGSTYKQLDPTQLQDSDAEAFALAYNPTASKIYVTDFNHDRITIIDAQDGHIIATLRHNKTYPNQLAQPAHLAVDSTSGRVYVANHNFGQPSSWVSVISGSNNQIIAQLYLGGDLYGVAADSIHHRIYVSSISAAKVFAIDSTIDTPLSPDSIQIVRQNPPGKPVPLRMVGVNPSVESSVHLWLTSSSEDQFGVDKLIVLSLDPGMWPPSSLSPVAMSVTSWPRDGLVVDPASGRVFVSSADSIVAGVQDNAMLCSTPLAPSDDELVLAIPDTN